MTLSFSWDLPARLYEDDQLLARLRSFVESEPGMLVFDERYLAVLQRLLVEHAAPTAGHVSLTGQQVSTLLTCLLAIPGVVTSRAPEGPPEPGAEDDQLDDWTAFVVQGGAYYEKPDLGDAIARAQALYCDLPQEPRLAANQDACPFEDWLRSDYGVGIPEQLAAGFAAAIMSKAVDPDLGLVRRKVGLEPGWLGHGPLGEREEEEDDGGGRRVAGTAALVAAGLPGFTGFQRDAGPRFATSLLKLLGIKRYAGTAKCCDGVDRHLPTPGRICAGVA